VTTIGRVHYAWVVVGVTAFVLLTSAGVGALPGLLIQPLEAEFGWSRAAVSLAVGISLLTLGLGAPLSGGLMSRLGPRRVALLALGLMTLGLAPLLFMSSLWQLHLFWGLFVGLGTGAIGGVLGATVAVRWFRTNRGLVLGLFGGASSAGQLLFVPALMYLTVQIGWRGAVGLCVLVAVAMMPLVLLFLRDRPETRGLRPYGEGEVVTADERSEDARSTPLRQAFRTRDFWLLAASFFTCGYTSMGLVGTHLIPHALEHGFTQAAAASALSVMGLMNVVGTTASGWLSDRFDPRKLLAGYYGFRALSLAGLPFILDLPTLMLFAVVFGLDYIATVPPTVKLATSSFGRASLATIYGWIFFSHMVGAGLAAYGGGFFHDLLGDYHLMFISAAILGFIAAGLCLGISPIRRPVLVPAPSAVPSPSGSG
jgi:predicted MFS family arabinose efflux permease